MATQEIRYKIAKIRASLRTSLFLRYNTEHIFYLYIIINKLNYCRQYIKLYRVMGL